jgi:hypothetical protein
VVIYLIYSSYMRFIFFYFKMRLGNKLLNKFIIHHVEATYHGCHVASRIHNHKRRLEACVRPLLFYLNILNSQSELIGPYDFPFIKVKERP